MFFGHADRFFSQKGSGVVGLFGNGVNVGIPGQRVAKGET